jgi:hypothetical protein
MTVEGANVSMEWIRRNYGVPAKRGGRVRFFGDEGTIASATHYLRVRMDDGRRVLLHPTWRVEYLSSLPEPEPLPAWIAQRPS